jgi:hypothetical protein
VVTHRQPAGRAAIDGVIESLVVALIGVHVSCMSTVGPQCFPLHGAWLMHRTLITLRWAVLRYPISRLTVTPSTCALPGKSFDSFASRQGSRGDTKNS